MKVGIIGSGVAGISTAIRLARKGYKVTVFEANSYLGGKLSNIEIDGFRFDAGPSLFTLPHLIDELTPETKFEYKRLDTICNYFWDDGTQFSCFDDKERLKEEIENKLNVSSAPFFKYLNNIDFTYNRIGEIFLEKSLHKKDTWLNKETLKAFLPMHKYSVASNLNAVNHKKLNHPKLTQLFNRFATYNGSSPYKAPGILKVIPHLELNKGAFFPVKGMHSITNALVNEAESLGVIFKLNERVEKINVDCKKATGLETLHGNYSFDKVVSNMDVYYTFHKLLNQQQIKIPEKKLKQERSSSAIIFYWGIKKEFKELDVHNIFFSNNYKEEFDYLFHKKDTCNDPTVYVHISSKLNKKDAPAGCENWFTMINVPSNRGQDWDKIIKTARKNVLKKLSHNLKIDVSKLIVCEDILEPRSIDSKTKSYQGSLYGTSSNSKFAAFLRHPNFSKDIKDLYFCGGSVHPGGGIPLAVLSSKIVAEEFKDLNA